MSFNKNDINQGSVNRTNYEEFFLLYIDDELTAEEKKDVENFVSANPDLQAELEILLNTKAVPEPVTLNKEELSAQFMQLNEMNETLLLYLDDELPQKDQEALKDTLRHNKEYQQHFELLQKTKLDKNEAVIFPYKQDLYRRSTPVRFINSWLRVAVIVAILLSAALVVWLAPSKNVVNPSIAHHSIAPLKDTPVKKDDDPKNLLLPPEPAPEIALQKHPGESKKTSNLIAKTKASKRQPPLKEILQHASVQEEVATMVHKNKNEDKNIITDKITTATPAKQSINKLPVTSAVPAPYTNTEAPAITMVSSTVASTDDDNTTHKTPLKGFLRKATRFIERRTNINPTNEDDELLIGAVSFKLK